MEPQSPKTRRPLDAIDAENIGATLDTAGWWFIEDRIRHYLKQATDALILPQPEAVTNTLRGEIKALKTVLGLPAKLIQEGKANGHRPR